MAGNGSKSSLPRKTTPFPVPGQISLWAAYKNYPVKTEAYDTHPRR